jgi:hypothetical protein
MSWRTRILFKLTGQAQPMALSATKRGVDVPKCRAVVTPTPTDYVLRAMGDTRRNSNPELRRTTCRVQWLTDAAAEPAV